MDILWLRGRAVDLLFGTSQLCPMADCYVASAAREATSVAELAATKKEDKYSGLAADYLFQPIAVETLGPAQLMSRPLTFSHFWPRKLVIIPATNERQLFFVPARFHASTAIQRCAATRFLCI